MNGLGRARRALGRVAATSVVGLAGVGVGAPLAALFDVHPLRRAAAAALDRALTGVFAGQVSVDRVGDVGAGTVSGVEITVRTPEGQPVIRLHGVSANLDVSRLAGSFFRGGAIAVRLESLGIDDAEVIVNEDASGRLGLARALKSRAEPGAQPSGRPVTVAIPRLTLRHAWIHGRLPDAPTIDAELSDAAGAVEVDESGTKLTVDRAGILARGLAPFNPRGDLSGTVVVPSGEGPTNTKLRYAGQLGAVRTDARVALAGGNVDASVDASAGASALDALLARYGVPLHPTRAAHVHVDARGTFQALRGQLRADVGPSRVRVSGAVTLPKGRGASITASISADRLDLAAFSRGAPASRVDVSGDVALSSAPAGLDGTFRLQTADGTLAGGELPPMTTTGEVRGSDVRGELRVVDPRAPFDVRYTLAGRGAARTLEVAAAGSVPDLARVPRLGAVARGSVTVNATARANLASSQIDARADVRAANLAKGPVEAARAELVGRASGPLSRPLVAADLRADGASALGVSLGDVRATARGHTNDLAVTASARHGDGPDVDARARVVRRARETIVSGARADLARGDVKAELSVAEVRLAPRELRVSGLSLDGLGTPLRASLDRTTNGVVATASADDLDLARAGRLLHREDVLGRGHAGLAVDLDTRGPGAHGLVHADAWDLRAGKLDRGRAHVDLAFAGRTLAGVVRASSPRLGEAALTAHDVVLGGDPLAPRSWERATGSLAVHSDVDLGAVTDILPGGVGPIADAAGRLVLDAEASRATRDAVPDVHVHLRSDRLGFATRASGVGATPGVVATRKSQIAVRGLDVGAEAWLDGTSGEADVRVSASDAHGTLGHFGASAELPVRALRTRTPDLERLLETTPFSAELRVAPREIERLPGSLAHFGLQGRVALVADVEGTVREPRATVRASGRGLRVIPRGMRRRSSCALDLDAEATYDGTDASLEATIGEGRHLVADARAKVTARASDLWAQRRQAPWEASGSIRLDRFPLDVVGDLAAMPIRGDVTGSIATTGLPGAPDLRASLDTTRLRIARVTFPRGYLRVAVNDGALAARARLEQVDGFAEARATGALTFPNGLAPSLVSARPFDVGIDAKDFRIEALQPFVRGTFSRIEGRVDADARLRAMNGTGTASGGIVLRDGVLEVPAMGEALSDVEAKVTMRPWGTIRIDDVRGRAGSGTFSAWAFGEMRGLALQRGQAAVHVDKNDAVPFAIEGVPLGTAWGDVRATGVMSRDRKTLLVTAGVPHLHVQLPESTGHELQPLEPDPHVSVGVHVDGDFTTLPLEKPHEPRSSSALGYRIDLALGDDVVFQRDDTIQLDVRGKPTVLVDAQTSVEGTVQLTGGKLDVLGHKFQIERGTVNFTDRPESDPLVVMSAYWDAPDGTRVHADYVGPLYEGELTLRSEPALPRDQIIALIQFGSPEGAYGVAPGGPGTTATIAGAAAGNIAAPVLNRLLSGVASGSVTTRVDTSQAGNPKPEVAVQLSRRLSAIVAYNVGVPPPGQAPDRAELRLDLRLVRAWLLQAMVGDRGSTSFDVLWRHRY